MIALAVVLAVLVAIALVPVGVLACYDTEDGPTLRLMAGKLGLTLYPRRKKEPTRRQLLRQQRKHLRARAKTPKPEKVRKTKPAPKKKVGLEQLQPMLALAKDVLGDARRKLLVRTLWLRVTFGGDDAARSAMLYGRAWAVIGGVMPTLETLLHIENRDVSAEFDPTRPQMALTARLDLRMRIGAMVSLGVKAGVRFLKILIKQKKAVQTHESSSGRNDGHDSGKNSHNGGREHGGGRSHRGAQ